MKLRPVQRLVTSFFGIIDWINIMFCYIDITVTSYDNDIPTHRQIDCLVNSLFTLTSQNMSELRHTGGIAYKPRPVMQE